MEHSNVSRRAFLEHSMLALGASTLPLEVFGQTILRVRPEWETFKTTSSYDALLSGIKLMKANTNPRDAKSWTYWTNIHVNNCPHEVPYFLAWHRGYMFYFERQLRAISGDSQLVLPYWDYYKNPQLPAEFTNPNNANPLYVERVNTNVQQALSMAPFASDVLNFQRGQAKAFEPTFEDAPHNPIHNLIGNAMADMISPVDPIFWLHHANVDRLWVAWAGAGGGRKMPAVSNSYWSGKHIYTSSLNMLRSQTYSTRTALYYRYQNETMPAALPLAQADAGARDAKLFRVQANKDMLVGATPSVGSFRLSSPHQTSDTTFSLGGALDVGLSERSVGVQLPISAEHSRVLADIANGKAASIAGTSTVFRSAHLILDGIEMSELGKKGGYFYKVYLNIPSRTQSSGTAGPVYLGTLGPFEIHAAAHHNGGNGHGPMRMRYKIKRAFAGATATELGMMSVSFVRVSGNSSPKGGAIGIREVRLEAAAEADDS
jgi:tyrosinase